MQRCCRRALSCARHTGTSVSRNDPRWQKTSEAALAVLAGNVKTVPRYDHPVLVEGSVYPGIWQECGPHEGLVYGTLASLVTTPDGAPTPLQIARNNHMAFFALQRPVGHESAGQLPAAIKMSDVGYGQIQMVVPIAATAWELAQLTDDDELLVTAYTACSRWDAWLREYRDTRKTGLVEGFCTYDTGHDNSPRWDGIPNRCPDGDARKCPPIATMPRLCPDLSATVFGARMALAHMATALGKGDDASRWHDDAETIRQLIIEKLYDPKDACFYDLDAQDNFVRVRSDVNSRVLGEHVLQALRRERQSHLRCRLDTPDPQPQSLLGPLSPHVNRDGRPHLRQTHSAQQLGRREPGPYRSACSPLDALLRQAGRDEPPDAAVVRGHQPPYRVPPADGPADRRLHPGRSQRLFPRSSGLSRLRSEIEPHAT